MAITDSISISQLVELRLLPWVTQKGASELVVARARLREMKGSTQLSLAPRKIQGPRKAVRTFTFGGITAQWPNDELIATQAPLLLFVLEGKADLHCGDYIMHVPQDQAVFVPAGVPRWTGVENLEPLGDDADRFCDSISFSERCGSLQIWLTHDRGNQRFGAYLHGIFMVHNIRLVRLLEEIQQEFNARAPDYELISHRLLEVFLRTLQRDLRAGKAMHPSRLTMPEPATNTQNTPIVSAQQYVREHLHESLTQEKVARLVRLSRTQFIRRFREESGQTFNQFVTQCRVEQAQTLLEQTDFPLTFISAAVGYKSPDHFNTIFRKSTGLMPIAFRSYKKETDKRGA